MESVEFVVPDLDAAGVIDLSNALTSLSGVGHVRVDAPACRVTIEYDPEYSTVGTIKGSIVGAGYGVGGQKA